VTPLTLAVLLTRFTEEPVIDSTGLTAGYDVQLEWKPEDRKGPNPVGAAETADTGAPSLFAALREQLGLRLDTRKGPMDVVVLDHVERVPLGN